MLIQKKSGNMAGNIFLKPFRIVFNDIYISFPLTCFLHMSFHGI